MRRRKNSLSGSNTSESLSRSEEKNENRIKTAPSLDQRAKERAATDQRIIGACAIAGGFVFFILNFTTGVVPGGFLGGAIGGGLGAVAGMIINSLRPKDEQMETQNINQVVGPAPEIVCSKCGNVGLSKDRFCRKCGNPLK
jgi:hypothetical protein